MRGWAKPLAELVIGPATLGRTRWLAYVAGIHVLSIAALKSWMAGTSPAMTVGNVTVTVTCC